VSDHWSIIRGSDRLMKESTKNRRDMVASADRRWTATVSMSPSRIRCIHALYQALQIRQAYTAARPALPRRVHLSKHARCVSFSGCWSSSSTHEGVRSSRPVLVIDSLWMVSTSRMSRSTFPPPLICEFILLMMKLTHTTGPPTYTEAAMR
jgi:hypothetical protein